MNFNQKIYSEEDIQKFIIEDILRGYKKNSLIKNDKEYETLYAKIQSKIKGDIIISKKCDLDGKADAIEYNKIFENIYIDLLNVYKKMNITGDKIEEHSKLHQSIMANNRTRLDLLSDNLERLEERLFNASDDYTYIERFRTTDSFETDSSLYRDEDFNLMSRDQFVSYNKYGEYITLTRTAEINNITAGNGQKMAEMKINKQLGSGLINVNNSLNDITKAYDTNMSTYWEETIYANEPIQIELDEHYWYNSFGALCELEITFSTLCNINEIVLMPYGKYPLEVIGIKSYTNDYSDESEQYNNFDEIVSPNNSIKIQRSIISREYIIYQFQTVKCKKLRIILNQRHYIRNSCIIDKNEDEKNNLWYNNEINIKLNVPQVGTYSDKGLIDKIWLLLSQKISKINIASIKEMLFPKTTDKVPITRYEYNYGLYNLSVKEVDYTNRSIYVSKPIKLNKNISMVSMSVDTIIPQYAKGYMLKYYITVQKYPNKPTDWIEIIPNNNHYIDFKEKGILSLIATDIFISKNNTSFSLSHTPYIIFSNKTVDAYINVTIMDKNGLNKNTKNVTNYYNPLSSNHNFINKEIYEYYIYKNKIYFNQKIPNGYKIHITYRHYIDMLRVKVIFIKPSNIELIGTTPILNEYKLNFKIIQ